MNQPPNLKTRLGPGLLFAAAAVGTSHVVQSTRAGAGFGLTLGLLIIAMCLLKYPLFRFAADYAASTGESLVRGFARRSRWLAWLMFVTSAIEAVAATAGISLVTAAILQWLIGSEWNAVPAAVALMLATAALVSVGRYRVLENLTTVLVIVFSLLTGVATVASLPALITGSVPVFGPFPLTVENTSFAIGLSGWMPIGNTAAIMLAAWIVAKQDPATLNHPATLDGARFDFNLGYVASSLLALCFLAIGAAVLYGQGEGMPQGSAQFVATFVGLYTSAIGDWSMWIVSVAALTVMYSTMLAIVDGFPRLIAEFIAELGMTGGRSADHQTVARVSMLLVVTAASLLLLMFFDNFAAFVDLVTILGFLAAPLVAVANQLVIGGANVPEHARPGSGLIHWNLLAVALLTCATVGFLYLRVIA